ncbi:MAG: hypothetical protein Q4B80_06045 [Aerococcaceae bacterium]|nr:hypothetical protein [Aerococcaceae bacterium]
MEDNGELEQKFDDLQARYDAIFIDENHEFSYKGFSTEEERNKFVKDLDSAVQELRELSMGKYIIVVEDRDTIYVKKHPDLV